MKTKNTFIIHPETLEQEKALRTFIEEHNIKYEIRNDIKSHGPDFGTKIQESRGQATDDQTDFEDTPKE